MESSRDKLTLDELAVEDIDNQLHILKGKTAKVFNDPEEALTYMWSCVLDSLYRVCQIQPGMKNDEQSAQHLKFNSKYEQRDHYEGNDDWKNGHYIYKDGELASFTSIVRLGKTLNSFVVLSSVEL